jgi:hypothetical protein
VGLCRGRSRERVLAGQDRQPGVGRSLEQGLSHVPAGRGPSKSWEDAAVDALVNCAPRAARNKDWSIGGILAMLELYKGLGYAARGSPSPYIWSGTDQYVSGKYVRDGVYDPNAADSQLGCAGLLMAMMTLDPSITFLGASVLPVKFVAARTSTPIRRSTAPSVTQRSKGSIGAFVVSIFSAVFKRK